jgi:hypothetical protein
VILKRSNCLTINIFHEPQLSYATAPIPPDGRGDYPPIFRHSGESRNPVTGANRWIVNAGFRIAQRVDIGVCRISGPLLVRNDERMESYLSLPGGARGSAIQVGTRVNRSSAPCRIYPAAILSTTSPWRLRLASASSRVRVTAIAGPLWIGLCRRWGDLGVALI